MSILDERIQPKVVGLDLPSMRRPKHGEFDVGLALALAGPAARGLTDQATENDIAAGCELCARVAAVLVAIASGMVAGGVVVRLERGDRAAIELAIDVADAISEALGLNARGLADLLYVSGIVRAPCRRRVLDAAGRPVRPWADGEERPECGYGCPEGHCAAEVGPSLEAARAARDWQLCGGMARTCLPRRGGLEDQDAAEIYWFCRLDQAVRTLAHRRD